MKKRKIAYPYTLEKKDDVIKLEIGARKSFISLYGFILFSSVIAMAGSLFFTIVNDSDPENYMIVACLNIVYLIIILGVLYIFNWDIKGKEIFILHLDKLEYIIENKPYKIKGQTFYFSQIEFHYDSGVVYYSEEEARELNIGLLDTGKDGENYPIRFFMNDERFIDSERKIPIDVIRRMKKEFLLIQKAVATNKLEL